MSGWLDLPVAGVAASDGLVVAYHEHELDAPRVERYRLPFAGAP